VNRIIEEYDTAHARKKRIPYSTVVTWAWRKKLDAIEVNERKYVSEKQKVRCKR
jgi:hypothetical protein